MDDKFVNKIKTSDEQEYTINDGRIPAPTAEDAGKILTVNELGDFCYADAPTAADQLEKLLNGELETLSFSEPVNEIKPNFCNYLKGLKTIYLNGVKNGIGEYAFTDIERLSSIDLGKVKGKIGDFAFAGLVDVNHFSISSESDITDLGASAFAGIGMDRNSAERFVFDFRNSSFTDFEGFGTPSIPEHFDSGKWIIVPETLGIGLTNADIYLPESVVSFADFAYTPPGPGDLSGHVTGGSGGVLDNCTNIDLYIANKNTVIQLKDLTTIPTDDESHIYVPFEVYGEYSLATNWAAYENLIGYIEDSVGLLPMYDTEGYELAWYKDKDLTEPATLGTGNTVYGIQTGSRLRSKIILCTAYKGTVQITATDSSTTFELGELIPVNTEITITPVCTELGEPVLNLFKINDQVYNESVTLTLTEDTIIVEVYYNVPEVPEYLKLENERSWSPSSEINTIAYNSAYSGELPSHIDIMPFYIKDGNIYEVKYLKSYIFNNRLTNKDYYITLPNTLISLPSYGFSNCSIRTINIPKTVEYIYNCAFYNCSNLEAIDILPKSVHYVGMQAFGACQNLTNKNIYYEGKPGDIAILIWDNSPDSTSNKPFKDALLYYAEELPEDLQGARWWHYVDGSPTEWEVERHYSDEWSYDEKTHWHQCIDPGFEYLKKDVGVHDLDEEEIYVPPTETEDGYIGHRCKVCDYIVTCRIPALNNFIFTPLANDTYSIKGNNKNLAGDIILPREYDSKPITSIDDLAFYEHTKLTSISLSNSIISIGDEAFSNCYKLTFITIPSSVTSIGFGVFNSCSSSLDINYKGTLESWLAFQGKNSLNGHIHLYFNGSDIETTSIVIPDNITFMGSRAFRNCSNLTSITLPDSVTSIDSLAFSGCSSLKSIIIPSSVNSINDNAFSSCSSLKSVILPDSVTSIGNFAFAGCSNLTSITIPNTVTFIGSYAFNGCSNLTSIIIPDSITYIGSGVFLACYNLMSIEVDINNSKYDSRESCNAIIETDTNTLICGCSNTIIPNSITSIGDEAFSDCFNLTSITIPESVTSINDNAFSRCYNLTSINLPDSITSIGFGVFNECSNLTLINIPNSVNSIGDYAFFNCSNLTSITIPANITYIGDSEFSGCLSLTSITIPVSVTSINDNAFSYCSSLIEFNYSGTVSEWETINLWQSWKIDTPFTVVHCSDGDVQVE